METRIDAETTQLLTFAESLAEVGRHICLEAMQRNPKVQIKPDKSFVTETDLAIEARLREMIDSAYPNHGVLGEEYGNRDIDQDYVWVLDPIDGTAAFVAGIPVFGTLIGLARDGNPYLGIIDHPATDQRWIGVSGVSALLNGREVQTRRSSNLPDAFLTNSNPDFMDYQESKRFHALRKQVQYAQYGGSCYAYAMLASGRTDLAVDAGLDPFDIFACAAVIEGAGGVITDWDGAPITLSWSGRVLASGGQGLHEKALTFLSKV